MFECQNYNALRSFKRHAAFFYLNSFWSNTFLGLRRKAIEVKKIATPHPHAERTEIGFGVLFFITFAITVCMNKKLVSDNIATSHSLAKGTEIGFEVICLLLNFYTCAVNK